MQTPSWPQALLYWLRLGCLSFGGPAAQMALMHEDLVVRRRWISESHYLHALNFCMVLPGPEAQQLATYIGWLMHGKWGGLMAGGLFVLPSLCLLMGLSWAYMAWGHLPVATGILYGLKPVVAALVIAATVRMGMRAVRHRSSGFITVAAFLALAVLKWPFPWIILSAGLAGLLCARWAPKAYAVDPPPMEQEDRGPRPQQTRASWRQLFRVLLAGLGIWAVGISMLILWMGWDALLTQMAWFFTQAALLTFGGAYAVLPYVFEAAVADFQWLTVAQMMDGLALGETTPGPLIMIVSYIGFIGGWTQAFLGPQAQLEAGVVAAGVATLFTFLPSFILVFAGAPFIESMRKRPLFTAPLAGITAAVVGVMASLAVFLLHQTLWPTTHQGQFDSTAALMTVCGLFALLRLKVQAIVLIVIGGTLGGLIGHP